MPGSCDYLRRIDLIEQKNDFDVRELIESRKAIRRKLRGVEFNSRLDSTPDVVDSLFYRADDASDGDDFH